MDLGINKKAGAKPIKAKTGLTSEFDLDAIVESVGKGKWSFIPAKEISSITKEPGVYLFALPAEDRHSRGILTLYGRTFGPKEERRQIQMEFSYVAKRLEKTPQVILYAGKAANLRNRLKMHLSLRDSSTTSQMLKGMASQAVRHGQEYNRETALAHILEQATIYYYPLGHPDECKCDPRTDDEIGQSLAADRDLLEIKLIAKYAPPFNLKVER